MFKNLINIDVYKLDFSLQSPSLLICFKNLEYEKLSVDMY